MKRRRRNYSPAFKARVVLAGGYHTCGTTSAGGVACWGDNSGGQLGNNTPGASSSGAPLQVLTSPPRPVYSTSIDPAAGLFVSVDGTHHSIGIGSGWPNLASTLPGGIMSDSFSSPALSPVDSYNLATPLAPVRGHQISNYLLLKGWPATNTTIPLIGGGAMLIEPQAPTNSSVGTKGTFSATALTPMGAFTALGGWSGAPATASIHIQGTLTLGTGGTLFDATTDDVVFGFGPYTAVIPAKSFSQSAGNSPFLGNINGSTVQMKLRTTTGSTNSFSIAVQQPFQ